MKGAVRQLKCQWLRPGECMENFPSSQLWAPERVLPHSTLQLCGLTASCTHILRILTVNCRNRTQNHLSKKETLLLGPRCSQNGLRNYRNLVLGTKAGPEYARILSLSIQLSSLHFFACWPDSLPLARSGFLTHQDYVGWKQDCFPKEARVPGRPRRDIREVSNDVSANVLATALSVLHTRSRLGPKLTVWGWFYIRSLPVL